MKIHHKNNLEKRRDATTVVFLNRVFSCGRCILYCPSLCLSFQNQLQSEASHLSYLGFAPISCVGRRKQVISWILLWCGPGFTFHQDSYCTAGNPPDQKGASIVYEAPLTRQMLHWTWYLRRLAEAFWGKESSLVLRSTIQIYKYTNHIPYTKTYKQYQLLNTYKGTFWVSFFFFKAAIKATLELSLLSYSPSPFSGYCLLGFILQSYNVSVNSGSQKFKKLHRTNSARKLCMLRCNTVITAQVRSFVEQNT